MSLDPLKWYDHNADNPRWIKALAEARTLACRELVLPPRPGHHRLD